MSDYITTPVNSNAQKEVRTVLKYLADITGKKMILGQHTQTMRQEELDYIKTSTNKLPALCGFELLGYSPNINYDDIGPECELEVNENKGTIERAWDWADRKGLITFTWHWFSPVGGRDKSFYSANTEFDASRALIEGTKENRALLADMDYMAGILTPFCDKHIPLLWRPFHECDGEWFWWGRAGAETAKGLYRLMYEHFTFKYKLNNLIWVFNAPKAEYYPGDDVVDIISRDFYPPAHEHTELLKELDELKSITPLKKISALAEIGTVPDVEAITKQNIGWAYYMTWSNDFGRTEKFTSKEELRRAYNCKNAVTLENLPILY